MQALQHKIQRGDNTLQIITQTHIQKSHHMTEEDIKQIRKSESKICIGNKQQRCLCADDTYIKTQGIQNISEGKR